jgi:hypothetical protein
MGLVAGFCEHINKTLCFIQGMKFLDQLSQYQLTKEKGIFKSSSLFFKLFLFTLCRGYVSLPPAHTVFYNLNHFVVFPLNALNQNRFCEN